MRKLYPESGFDEEISHRSGSEIKKCITLQVICVLTAEKCEFQADGHFVKKRAIQSLDFLFKDFLFL